MSYRSRSSRGLRVSSSGVAALVLFVGACTLAAAAPPGARAQTPPTGPGPLPGETGPAPGRGETAPRPSAPLPTPPPAAPPRADVGPRPEGRPEGVPPAPPPKPAPALPGPGADPEKKGLPGTGGLEGPRLPAVPPIPEPGAPARRVLALGLKEAIVRAIQNSPELDVQRVQVRVARSSVDIASGEFDLFLFSDGALTKFRTPFFSRNPFGGDEGVNPITGLSGGLIVNQVDDWVVAGGIRQRTPLGTSYEVRYEQGRRKSDNVFSLNPSYTPSVVFEVTQPILRGFSFDLDVPRSQILIATKQVQSEQLGLREQALNLAVSVEEAYWTYVFSLDNLRVAERALANSEELLEINKTKLAVGKAAEIDVLIAETQVASRREAIIVARSTIENTRDQLLRLVQPSAALGEWEVEILPLDRPRLEDVNVDLERAFLTALAKRPDYARATIDIEAQELRVDRAANDRLPRLDILGSATINGLGNSPDNAHDALGSGDYYDLRAGFSFEIPIPNRTGRGTLEQAELQSAQSRRRRDILIQDIILQVRTGARDLETARERIRATEVAARLAERQLENEKERLRVGLVTSYEVFLAEEQLTQAQVNLLRAMVDYSIARARLDRSQATNLERYEIVLE